MTKLLYNLQQPIKKIDVQKFSKILSELDIAAHLVYNTHAKKVSMSFTAKKRKSNRLENKRNSSSSKNNQEEDLKKRKKCKAKSRREQKEDRRRHE